MLEYLGTCECVGVALEGGKMVEQNKSGVSSLRNEPQLVLIYYWL